MAECMLDEPPPLIDITKRIRKAREQAEEEAKKAAEANETNVPVSTTEEGAVRTEDEAQEEEEQEESNFWDDDDFDFDLDDDDDEEEEDEEEDELEEEDEEEDEDEEEEESDEDDEPEPMKEPHVFHPSDENFVESDLADRKRRRFLIGSHSFLDLTDPHLEDALDPEGADEDDANLTEEERTKKRLKAEKDAYKKACEELGVKPDPRVLAGLRQRVMDLRAFGMNWKEITAVCKVLEMNTYVQYLILAENAAGLEGGLAIAELISKNKSIISYDLASTEILEAFPQICDAIAQNQAILHLNLSKNDLEDMDMPYVKKILREIPLQSLSLNANLIKDDGLRHIGQGLSVNQTLEEIDLSYNKINGDKKAGIFFASCGDLPALKVLNLRRNLIRDDGGKGVARVIAKNPALEELDVSFNIMEEGSAAAFGKALGRLENRNLRILLVEFQRWRQDEGAAVLKPLGNSLLNIPLEMLDFGMMLDIHTNFIKAKDRALKVHPDMVITHGQAFGLEHAKGPEHRQLVIRKADAVCKSFETPLVMLMEELAKEKDVLTQKEFRKFIKQCNLYKDKALNEAFLNVFAKTSGEGQGGVDAVAILEAFDKEYPGLRVIPEPKEEEEETEEKPKKEKKKKGKKGKGRKNAAGGGGKGKGKKKGKKAK